MFVEKFTVGILETNCYLVADEDAKEAVIIDPGFNSEWEAKNLLNKVAANDFSVRSIINTHGHPDHTAGNRLLKDYTKAPILIHRYDAWMLINSIPDKTIEEGDVIDLENVKLRVFHTPGHTKGSIILLGAAEAFTGDTLFAGSIGRYDLPGGSFQEIVHSIRFKLMTLSDSILVYPGHGLDSTIGEERRTNPYLQ